MPLFGGNGFLGTNWTPIQDLTKVISNVTGTATSAVGGVVSTVTPLVTNLANSTAGTAAASLAVNNLTGGSALGSSFLGGLGGAKVTVNTGPGYTEPATWLQKQIYKVGTDGKFILNTDKSKQFNWGRIAMWLGGGYFGYLVIKRMVRGRWSWI